MKILILTMFLLPLYSQFVPFNGYIDSEPTVSGAYLIQVSISNDNNQVIWIESFSSVCGFKLWISAGE